jgi:CRISPR/Cas system CMR-associated protein Cmr1 (group 7 of RAMP superfamily)
MTHATRSLAFERRLAVLVRAGGVGMRARRGAGDIGGATVEREDVDQSSGDLRT